VQGGRLARRFFVVRALGQFLGGHDGVKRSAIGIYGRRQPGAQLLSLSDGIAHAGLDLGVARLAHRQTGHHSRKRGCQSAGERRNGPAAWCRCAGGCGIQERKRRQARFTFAKAVFDYLVRLEPGELEIPLRRIRQHRLWRQADQLGAHDTRAMLGRLAPHKLDDPRQRRLPEIGQVHRDLRFAFDDQPHRLDVAQSPAGMADCFGDGFGDFDILRVQIHVESDEKRTRADHGCAGRAELGRAKVGSPVGVRFDFGLEALVLAAPNIFQVGAVGSSSGGLVQVNRDGQLFAHARAEPPRHGDTVFHRDARDRDERHDICGADTRMTSPVLAEVNQLGGAPNRRKDSPLDRFRLADKGHDGTIVIGVGVMIEQRDAGRGRNGGQDGINHLGPAAFGKIGNTLDDLLHGCTSRVECGVV
jgi:hypothetical protein